MKIVCLAALGLSAFALIGCNGVEVAVVAPPPTYGWQPFHNETFEVQPLSVPGKVFAVPPSSSKLRVTIKSDSSVSGGALTQDEAETFRLHHRIPGTADYAKMRCSLYSVDSEEVTCEIDPHQRTIFIVEDDRKAGTVVLGVFGAFENSSKMAERASQPNKISIQLSAWQCVANCAKS
jgi:hypothetical protein